MTDLLWQGENIVLGPENARRLNGVSFGIHPGITAVVGSSGAGKTSLINLLSGFEKPDSGSLTFFPPEGEDRLPLYWVPQEGGLWPHLSVREHVYRAAWTGFSEEDLEALISRAGLSGRSAALPGNLSKGEQSRLNAVRGLAAAPLVLIMDEPFANVDSVRTGTCWDLVRTTAERTGTSLVFSTHLPDTVLAHAGSAICIDHGDILYSGRVDELYISPPTEKAAWCLGEYNWLDAGMREKWYCENGHASLHECVRPENLQITPAEQGKVTVESVLFRGSVEEAHLRLEDSDERKVFFRRPSHLKLEKGMKVSIRILLFLLIACIAGCGGASAPKLEISAQEYWNMPPEGSQLPAPRAAAAGPDGGVLVLDTAGRILHLDSSGKLIDKWFMPEYDVGKPEGICLLHDGRIAVADTHYSRVVFFDIRGKVLDMLGKKGTGPGEFIYPVGVTEDDKGNLYVCEYGSNDRVQKFSAGNKWIASFGSFGTGKEEFQRCSGILWHGGNVYVADAINNRIQVFTDTGEYSGSIVSGSSGLRLPYDVTSLGERLFTAEYGSGRVSVFDFSGRFLSFYGTAGGGIGKLRTPWGLCSLGDNRIVIADTGNRRLVVLTL